MAEPVPPEEPGMPRPSPRSGDDHARPAWLEGIEPDGGEGAAGTPAGPPPLARALPEREDPKPVPWRAAASGVPRLPSLAEPSEHAAAAPVAEGQFPAAAPAAARFHEADDDPGPDDLSGDVRYGGPGAGPLTLPPLSEPWWTVALDTLRTSTRARVIGGVAALALAAAAFALPRAPIGDSLAGIRRHPEL